MSRLFEKALDPTRFSEMVEQHNAIRLSKVRGCFKDMIFILHPELSGQPEPGLETSESKNSRLRGRAPRSQRAHFLYREPGGISGQHELSSKNGKAL